ncbi:hypothetical protein AWB67_05186 [Caballeronia terrestris]|uniref:Lipoprotein n=2 Tax=Caballeronia terrestris TaxID=1226301 RepID=A0A158KB51_9BURK|nr:hypothetical protein AWB67_05186 [Caballeronia terrestris]
MKTGIVAAVGMSVILAACGGGGDDGGGALDAASPTAAGQYTGTVSGRQASVLILDDGRVYTEYASPNSTNVIAGVVAGSVSSLNGNLSNGSGIDYNYEGQGVNSVVVSGSYSAKQWLKASVSYANGARSDFSGNYDASYDATPTQAAVAGKFTGSSATNIGTTVGIDSVTITVDAAGNIAGNGTNCPFTGTIKPHAKGNVYDVSLTFGAGTGCAYPNTTASGIGVLNGSQIHALAQTPSKAGVVFIGTK